MNHFSNKDREGANLLAKAGYVEFEQFKNMVIAQLKKTGKVYGYFCANCEYLRGNRGMSNYKLCARLEDAEVKDYGCCNLWEYTAKPTASSFGVAKKEKKEGLANMMMPPSVEKWNDK